MQLSFLPQYFREVNIKHTFQKSNQQLIQQPTPPPEDTQEVAQESGQQTEPPKKRRRLLNRIQIAEEAERRFDQALVESPQADLKHCQKSKGLPDLAGDRQRQAKANRHILFNRIREDKKNKRTTIAQAKQEREAREREQRAAEQAREAAERERQAAEQAREAAEKEAREKAEAAQLEKERKAAAEEERLRRDNEHKRQQALKKRKLGQLETVGNDNSEGGQSTGRTSKRLRTSAEESTLTPANRTRVKAKAPSKARILTNRNLQVRRSVMDSKQENSAHRAASPEVDGVENLNTRLKKEEQNKAQSNTR